MRVWLRLFLSLACSLLVNGQASAFDLSGTPLFTAQSVHIEPGKKGLVVLFLSAKCPCSNHHLEVIKKLAHDFTDFSFVAVHSNADESVEVAKTYFEKASLSFPILQDQGARLANQLKAYKTPHAFVFAVNGDLLFKGGVTNSVVGSTADKQYLRDALNDIMANRPVKNPEARTLGCAIAR
jgi:peroxiredoxin